MCFHGGGGTQVLSKRNIELIKQLNERAYGNTVLVQDAFLRCSEDAYPDIPKLSDIVAYIDKRRDPHWRER